MKKTTIIVIVAMVIIISVLALYIKKEVNYPPKMNTVNCCEEKNIVCTSPGEQPTCMEINLGTGQKYPEPKCMCLNPNMEY